MTAQDLKNSILQMAVQGKLVPQQTSDGTAAELLKKIDDYLPKCDDMAKLGA